MEGAYTVKGKKNHYSGIIVSSCRFKNEVEAVKTMGGITVRLRRPALSNKEFLQTGVKNHISEKEQLAIPDDFFDYVISVPEGRELFYQKIDELMNALNKMRYIGNTPVLELRGSVKS